MTIAAGLPPKGDVSDWIEAGGAREELLRMAEEAPLWVPREADNEAPAEESAAPRREQQWESPIPLSEYDLPPFPVEALPLWLRDFVEGLAEATQTPADLSGLLTLAIIAAATSKKFTISPRPGWVEPLNIFTVTVLPPASRKSAVFRECAAPLTEYEKAQAKEAAGTIARAKAERKTLEMALNQAQLDASKAKAKEEERHG
jgi:hypothetical protein